MKLLALISVSLLSGASALSLAPGGVRFAQRASSPTIKMQNNGKSRYADDGSRLKGADTIGDVDNKLRKGWFSNFKFGTDGDAAAGNRTGVMNLQIVRSG